MKIIPIKLSLKINVGEHLDKGDFISYITPIMIGTYTTTNFRLPRPAGAGLAMTLYYLELFINCKLAKCTNWSGKYAEIVRWAGR